MRRLETVLLHPSLLSEDPQQELGHERNGQLVRQHTLDGGMIRLSNSEVSHNGTGVNGAVNSFSSNEFVSNGAGGAIPTIGLASSPTGQQ